MNKALANSEAIAIAIQWITTAELPFTAAFIGGSIASADPGLAYDSDSDIDCYLVVPGEPPEGKIGKITVDGVLLDVSWLSSHQLANVETNAVLASLLRFGRVVVDHDGELTCLQQAMTERFDHQDMIAVRLEDMRSRIRNGLAGDSSHLPQPEQVMNWLFPATLATHIPLVAACAPLTVRKRFLAAKRVMTYEAYEELLDLYGFGDISPALAQQWLDETAIVLDAAAPIAENSSRFWSSDIQEHSRAIAIGGSQRLIDTGHHREALYWIIATNARCLTVLEDVGIDTSPFLPAFIKMTTTLAISTSAERAPRSASILRWTESYDQTN